MKILFAATEGSPFIKTGGLGDVIGSLPQALYKEGADVRVIMPCYRWIPQEFRDKMTSSKSFNVPVGWRNQECNLMELEHEGVTFYFVGNQYYFDREGIYGHFDDGERFAYFCRAVLEALGETDFIPDVIHCHDWFTGLIPVMLKAHYSSREEYSAIKTLFTIHNLHYQGSFPREILGDILGLGDEYFTSDTLELYGQVSYLKGGLVFADKISTVSRTYAEEIKNPEFGERLDGILRSRGEDLAGIVNGIDYGSYNPANDPNIYMNYTWSLQKKQKNKEYLQAELGLPIGKDIPMAALISRLVDQKGMDLIMGALDEIMSLGVQLVILGTGEYHYEEMVREAARRYPGQVSANIYFDEILARKIYASSDIYLMPSYFEPCGISQLIAMRYGAVPVVRATGGLKDTVQEFSEETGEGTGFVFDLYNQGQMMEALKRALKFYKNSTLWSRIIRNMSREDFSWRRPAKEYLDLYEALQGGYQEKIYVFG